MGKLKGKIAVITGASRGFGLAIARAYVLEGASLVIASRSGIAVSKAVNDLKVLGGNVSGLSADISQLDQVEALAEFAQRVVWLASSATLSRYGLVLRELGLLRILSGALKENFRRLSRKPQPGNYMEISSIPSSLPTATGIDRR